MTGTRSARAATVAGAAAAIITGCSASSPGSAARGPAPAPPPPAQVRLAPLPRSLVLLRGRVSSDVVGSQAAGGGTVSASQASSTEQQLRQLHATRNDQGVVITLPERVLFDFDKADLRPDAGPALAQIAKLLTGYPQARVSVRGYTDSVGSDSYNLDLSQRRAEAVRQALAAQPGAVAAHLEAVGQGKADPVAPNTNPDGSDNPDGRQQNRRVEVVILGA